MGKNVAKHQIVVILHEAHGWRLSRIASGLDISRERVRQIYEEAGRGNLTTESVSPEFPAPAPDAVCNVCGVAYSKHEPKSFVARRESAQQITALALRH